LEDSTELDETFKAKATGLIPKRGRLLALESLIL
jgi:hypothetical protein